MTNLADYVFTNMPAHLTPLEAFLDPVTQDELDEISVGAGWRCLDLAAGGGSVTAMLSQRVGPAGRVFAIDQDVHMLTPGPNVEIHTQDLGTDEPLPVDGSVDLIHARLLTHHLPNRREVVHRLAGTLKPGGWLLLGEFVRTPPRVLAAATEADADLYRKVMDTLFNVLAAKVDIEWGHQVHMEMVAAGLTSVRTRWHSETFTGGTHGCRLVANNVSQKRAELVAAGLAPEEVDTFTEKLMYNPALVVRSYEFCSIRGQRPE
ncbi:class I SAM-dependent methyltransferase [Micromonospora sp. SL1-18]|uniref:class I SAM-dependent methyltransferase n=1 Tax=Micromonospora sp. SL1-18 TaxID=3399128 RepID=UPI003A4DAFF9